MSKKIKPNLSLGIRPNSDGNAMLDALGAGAKPTAALLDTAPGASPITGEGHQAVAFNVKTMTVSDLRIGSTYELPLALLSRSDNNARVYYNPEEIDETAESIARNGQEVPALGYVKGDTVVIVDGQKRFNACADRKIPTLRVVIREAPASGAEEYEASRRINIERSAQTPFDDAVRWSEMLTRGDYKTQDELAQRLALTPSTVSKTLGLNRIPVPLRRLMIEHPQTATLAVAYEISNIFGKASETNMDELEAIAEDVANTVIKKGLGREQTIELVRSKIDGPKTRVRGDSVPVKYGQHKGAIKIVPSRGEFSMSFRGLSEEEIEELKRRVESILAGQQVL